MFLAYSKQGFAMIITEDFIPLGSGNRPADPIGGPHFVTIHNTADPGATARQEAAYLKSAAAAQREVSWHYSVDDQVVIQHLPLTESGWHAADGRNGPGNRQSIGIEICEVENQNAADDQAARLAAMLLDHFGLPVDRVVQHHHWYPKDCPRLLRHPAGKWEAWLKKVEIYRTAAIDTILEEAYSSVPDPLWTFGLKLFKGRYAGGREVLVTERAILEWNLSVAAPWNVTIRHCGKEIAERLVGEGRLTRL
jgi:N-acetylmuramoyl-L-alanine amidase